MDFRDEEDLELSKKGISQFDEQVEYYQKIGLTYTEAKNKAIDWYRRYGSKEVTVSTITSDKDLGDDGYQEEEKLFGSDSRPNQEAITHISSLVRKYLEHTKSNRDKRYFVVLIRAHGLDQYLDEDTFDLISSVTDAYPVSSRRKDIAESLGLKVKENGSSSHLYLIHNEMKKKFIELFGGDY